MTGTDSTVGFTVVHDAAELVVDPDEGTGVVILEDATFAAFDGKVVAVSPTAEVLANYPIEDAETAIGATDKTILPDFVDPYTHALFTGDRSDEFMIRLQDATYGDILADDGGILRTVNAVHGISDDELAATLAGHLDMMLIHGTTAVEIKIGCGLGTEIGLRMFSIVDAAGSDYPVDVVPTFMGAHVVPRSVGAEKYTESVVSDQLPAVAAQGIAEFCDVSCGCGVFTIEQSRRILNVSRDHGLTPEIRTDELIAISDTDATASVGAANTDRLLHTDDESRDTLVDANIMPVLLPGTVFGLGADYADAHALLDAGHEVALATDFNSNRFARSMGLVTTLAGVEIRMTPHGAARGVTSTATGMLDRNGGTGVLRIGAPTDTAVLDVPTTSHLSCRFGTNLTPTVLKSGVVIHE